jgi:uncharacterized repeat protein (TIGR03803 family)
MKTKSLAWLCCLAVLAWTTGATAQTFTTLYSFSPLVSLLPSNSDGANPMAGLIVSGNTLYGTTEYGGTAGYGAVFSIDTASLGFTNLHSFSAVTESFPGTNGDGANPVAGLILSGNTLYGTTPSGGSSGLGTVFAVQIDGTGFTNLWNFTGGIDGSDPVAGLILSGNTLYGTTEFGGSSFRGNVFALNTDGTGFTNLYSFTNGVDGSLPAAGLILSGNTLYGTTQGSNGTVFALTTSSAVFTNLYTFTGGNDGSLPEGALTLSGGILYGAAGYGGLAGDGTVYALNLDSGSFSVLYAFGGGSSGADPLAGLMLSNNTLYGTTEYGGSMNLGMVFALDLGTLTFSNLYSFTGGSDGFHPVAGLTGDTLYGTTEDGGSSTNGVVFSLNNDGSGFMTLHSFNATIGGAFAANNDGSDPYAGVTFRSNVLFGVAMNGGSSDNGTVYAINTVTSGFTNLHTFGGNDGAHPQGKLILADDILYGTTFSGGISNYGSVFAVHVDGSGFTNLWNFTGGSDGGNPETGVVMVSNTLYGTTYDEGSNGEGTLFSVGTDGSNFTILHTFTGANDPDGEHPVALDCFCGCLYGTTFGGGTYGYGTLFKLDPASGLYTYLCSIAGGNGGENPMGGVVMFNKTLWGTTYGGGNNGLGALFAFDLSTKSLSTVYSFQGLGFGDGQNPVGSLTLSYGILRGTTFYGGDDNFGTVFHFNIPNLSYGHDYGFTGGYDGGNPTAGITLRGYGTSTTGGVWGSGAVWNIPPPALPSPTQLNISILERNVLLTWPDIDSEYILQYTTGLGILAKWGQVTPLPTDVGGLNTVLTPITGTGQYFRLNYSPSF